MDLTIDAQMRSETGKGYARKLRNQGKIPANLIGKAQSTMIELDPKMLPKAWQSPERTFTLNLDGKTRQVKIQELQIHPVKRIALHVDLISV